VYQKDAHGRGKARILVEQSFQPLFETSIETFMSQYPRARISAQYRTENDIIEAFYNNKSKTIVITRDFNDKEKEYLKSKNVSYRSDKIASDAVVIIMHPTMTDRLLSVDQIRNLLRGDKTKLPSNTL
jgi:phosphate transport system substrate-binding protein